LVDVYKRSGSGIPDVASVAQQAANSPRQFSY